MTFGRKMLMVWHTTAVKFEEIMGAGQGQIDRKYSYLHGVEVSEILITSR